MRPRTPSWAPLALAASGILAGGAAQGQTRSSGLQPEAAVLLVSEADGQGQMAVRNSDAQPLLLLTRVYDVTDDGDLQLVPLPPLARVEAQGRQVVRFALTGPGSARPLAVQHYKRVTFEGIPVKLAGRDRAMVQVNLRYDLPVIISPRGLPPEDAPWTRLDWSTDGVHLLLRNPSAYVVRMAPEVLLLPSKRPLGLLSQGFVLPGAEVSMALPEGIEAGAVTGVRLSPATLYGYAAADYDAAIRH